MEMGGVEINLIPHECHNEGCKKFEILGLRCKVAAMLGDGPHLAQPGLHEYMKESRGERASVKKYITPDAIRTAILRLFRTKYILLVGEVLSADYTRPYLGRVGVREEKRGQKDNTKAVFWRQKIVEAANQLLLDL